MIHVYEIINKSSRNYGKHIASFPDYIDEDDIRKHYNESKYKLTTLHAPYGYVANSDLVTGNPLSQEEAKSLGLISSKVKPKIEQHIGTESDYLGVEALALYFQKFDKSSRKEYEDINRPITKKYANKIHRDINNNLNKVLKDQFDSRDFKIRVNRGNKTIKGVIPWQFAYINQEPNIIDNNTLPIYDTVAGAWNFVETTATVISTVKTNILNKPVANRDILLRNGVLNIITNNDKYLESGSSFMALMLTNINATREAIKYNLNGKLVEEVINV